MTFIIRLHTLDTTLLSLWKPPSRTHVSWDRIPCRCSHPRVKLSSHQVRCVGQLEPIASVSRWPLRCLALLHYLFDHCHANSRYGSLKHEGHWDWIKSCNLRNNMVTFNNANQFLTVFAGDEGTVTSDWVHHYVLKPRIPIEDLDDQATFIIPTSQLRRVFSHKRFARWCPFIDRVSLTNLSHEPVQWMNSDI